MATRLKVEGIVLRTIDYGESDRIVTLLTRERGKLGAYARGARASRRRFAGLLEPFTLLSAELIDRRGDLLGLESASALRAHGGIRSDLARIADENRAAREAEIAKCRAIVLEKSEALWRQVAGQIAALGGSAPDGSAKVSPPVPARETT